MIYRLIQFAAIVLLILVVQKKFHEYQPGTGWGANKPAQEISGQDLAGAPMKLSEFRGKVVVLDFWAFW